MGAIGTILAGGLLGAGSAARQAASSPASPVSTALPEPPPPAYGQADAEAAMAAAREKEAAAARLRRQQSQTIFTSGLGAAGLAATDKKQLLGG